MKVSIVGVTGYTGEELLKILSKHKAAEVVGLYGREGSAERKLKDIYPEMKLDAVVRPLDVARICAESDVLFLALPHGAAHAIAAAPLKAGVKVIDLSADFRIRKQKVYESWYKIAHAAPDLLEEAVYGLCELNSSEIKNASLIANPGCYPTSIILACAPVLRNGLAYVNDVVIDSVSGISGAGREAAKTYFETEFPNVRPYKVGGGHRHIPEIEQELTELCGDEARITFTPRIIPVERGMLSAIYLDLKEPASQQDISNLYETFYAGQPFVRVLTGGALPSIKNVVGTNVCEMAAVVDARTGKLVVYSAIDNLVKGASGQAVQCMNLIFGQKETEGLI